MTDYITSNYTFTTLLDLTMDDINNMFKKAEETCGIVKN